MSSLSNRRCVADYEAVDRLSSLPDAVICHILSFISSKCAVETSVLSKRWKDMWTKVPAIDVTEMPDSSGIVDLMDEETVESFMDKVLLRNDVPCLQRFRFHIFLGHDSVSVNSWLGALARREICVIDLKIAPSWPRRRVPLPESFLSHERLVSLKLKGNFSISAPKSMHFPYLETVHLIDVELPDDEFMKRLSSSCPVLKILRIKQCTGITSTLYIESLTLKTLEVTIDMGNPKGSRIVMKVPNLGYLHLEAALTEYEISDLSSLSEAHLYISNGRETDDFFNDDDHRHAFEIARKVSGVTTLWLRTSQLLGCLNKPPIFSNLTHLKLDEFDDDRAYKILTCAPQLKSLTLGEVYRWDDSVESKPKLKCMSTLENVEFEWVKGRKEYVRFVEYILKAALVLKEMKLRVDRLPSKKDAVFQRLLKLPRSSVACQIVFHLIDEAEFY